ncbi:acyltransferase family protein [Corynebacterium pseudopelargi]|uniref:O-acetyltransferase OatA n=1 Tax=Corynebacterium pseudopelargi TaxID=2080757 RepID=A0A3G6IW18_9CORY|nr:acyltransferase family protein [Corynebacterium pseudopelargi]AZA09856.1 O-acetyltransferase OatA [Corynebacterium pseudopelargi]
MPENVKYRYDLDGLRGIAIAFVVIFHVFVGKVSGGVDVFLLLSGYFFLGSQLRYAQKPNAKLNPWWPLWRAIRRLVPSLIVVLLSTAICISILTPELKQADIGAQMLASMGYYQNWELLWQGQSYGAASASISPLQHLWSMSVQGQFYLLAIIFATFLAAIFRKKLLSLKIVAGIPLLIATGASMFYAFSASNSQLNYYSTWSRMWELTLGAVLLIYCSNLAMPTWLRRLLTIIGVIMVLSTGWIFDGATQFPGPAALYPLGGAALVIIAGRGGGVLGSAPMRYLGRIAYPLYLWHWPLLIVITAHINEPVPPVWLGILVVVGSVALAHLTHIFVEEPFMQHARRPAVGDKRIRRAFGSVVRPQGLLRALGGLVVVGLCITAIFIPQEWADEVEALSDYRLDPRVYPGAMALDGARVPQAEPKPDPYLLAETVGPAWTKGCMSWANSDPTVLPYDKKPDDCTFGDKDADTTAFLVGGSHAEQWMAAMDQLGKEHHFKVLPFVRQSCPAFKEELDGVFSSSCQTFNSVVMERIAEDEPDFVVSNSTRPLLELDHFIDEVPKSYPTFWEYLDTLGIPFIGLRDNPWFILPGGKGKKVSQCFDKTGDLIECGKPEAEFYAPEDPSKEYFDGDTQIGIDTSKLVCEDGFCPPVIGNIYVYRDGNHISDDFARSTVPLLWEQMRPLVEKAKSA